MEGIELNQSVAFSAAEDVKIARDISEDIISICEADDKFEVTLKKFSQLYEAINAVHNIDDDPIMHAFKALLLIFSTMDRKLEDFAEEIVSWKNKAQKAEKALDDQKKLNAANAATIARLTIEKRDIDEKVSNAADWLEEVNDKNEGLTNMLKEITNYVADIMYVTRGHDYDIMISKLTDISHKIGVKTSNDGPIYGISVILNTLIKIVEERNKALDLKEQYRRIANSVYGMTIPGRCCGKQMFYDVTTGTKILIDKKKYDDLVEYVANINLTYDNMFCMMDKPIYLSTITESLNDLTK